MERYPIPLVPGPVRLPDAVLAARSRDFGSGDLEPEYALLYAETEAALQTICATRNRVAIMTGEGMIALWGALKSVIQPGDRVVAISTGLFGEGIGGMAAQLGAEVQTVHFAWNEIADDPAPIRAALAAHRPRLVSLVHCETPSGTLNPAALVGALVREFEVPLFYVDAVASAAGTPLLVDEWGIDLALLGTQKALSAPPTLGMVAVSPRAWEIIEAVGYVGYDALLPWRDAREAGSFPYTPPWAEIAGLHAACRLVLDEGLEAVFARHAEVAAAWRAGLRDLGIRLFPAIEAGSAPTVTAAWLPEGWTWPRLDRALRVRGMVVGGTWGRHAGQLFRIGHMGAQATHTLREAGLAVLAEVVGQGPD